jgi:hypothetical protein
MKLNEMKKALKGLSASERETFVSWCLSYHQAQEVKELSRCSNGIKPTEALKVFRDVFAQHHNLDLPRCGHGLTAMINFYIDTRVRGCPFSADADMLLLQWGPDAAKRRYTISFTRQLIPQIREPKIWQLELQYQYALNTKTKKLGSGNQWCHSIASAEYNRFTKFIRGWEELKVLDWEKMLKYEMRYEQV